MAPPEITSYIRQARAQGMSDEQIKQQLAAAGWSQADVQNAAQSMQMMHQAQEPKPPSVAIKIDAFVHQCLRFIYVLIALVLLARFFASFAVVFADFDVTQLPIGQQFDALSSFLILSPLVTLGKMLEAFLTMYNLNYFAGMDLIALLTLAVYGLVYLILVSIFHKIATLFKK